MNLEVMKLAAIQGVLQLHGLYPGKVDGIMGPETRRAVAKGADVINTFRGVMDMPRSLTKRVLVSDPDVKKEIEDAATVMGDDTNYWMAKAKIESGFNPKAISPSKSHRGLFQLNQDAWERAAGWLKKRMGLELGEFDMLWNNPYNNTIAAIAYSHDLADQLKKLGYRGEVTATHRYLAHQQGAAGLVRLLKAIRGEELSPTDNKYLLRNMRNNVPQDGKGVTVDPAAFFARWAKVLDDNTNRYA